MPRKTKVRKPRSKTYKPSWKQTGKGSGPAVPKVKRVRRRGIK